MNRIVTGILIFLLAAPGLPAEDKPKDKPSTPAEQYKALDAEYRVAQKEFQDAMRKAKTQEERQKVFQEKAPKPDKLAPRFLELAEKYPKDAAAVDALVWVVNQTLPFGQTKDSPRIRALEILVRDHIGSEKLAGVCARMRAEDKAAETFLRAALEKSPRREVRGQACLALAKMLKGRAGEDKEVEQLLERVADNYADIKPGRSPIGGETLGDVAKRELFEIRNLAIGKPVPDIEGEDIDGKKFKLSDYRGKVVLLDFWGHW
jgi:hypothetical protein